MYVPVHSFAYSPNFGTTCAANHIGEKARRSMRIINRIINAIEAKKKLKAAATIIMIEVTPRMTTCNGNVQPLFPFLAAVLRDTPVLNKLVIPKDFIKISDKPPSSSVFFIFEGLRPATLRLFAGAIAL